MSRQAGIALCVEGIGCPMHAFRDPCPSSGHGRARGRHQFEAVTVRQRDAVSCVVPKKLHPNFERAESALSEALECLPLTAADGQESEIRREYVALYLFVLQTKERLALLSGSWEANGLPVDAPLSVPPSQRKPARRGTA